MSKHKNRHDKYDGMTDDEIAAEKYLKEVKGFYSHLTTYGIIIGGLFVLNMLTSPGYFWFIWPALGWGIGLAFHFLSVYGTTRFFTPEWEEEQKRRFMERRRGGGRRNSQHESIPKFEDDDL